MSRWPIRVFASWEEAVAAGDGKYAPPVGACWPEPNRLDWRPSGQDYIGANYFRDWASTRPPMVVELPGGVEFCIDVRAVRDGVYYGDGWVVTGEGPTLTLTPSIDVKGHYHGWIQNGFITNDCEGRTFE